MKRLPSLNSLGPADFYFQLFRPVQLLPSACLRWLSRIVAQHRTIAPWPGWVCDAIADDASQFFIVLRKKILHLYRQRNLNFLIDYDFQPDVKMRIRLTETAGRCLFQSGCYEPNEFAYLDTILKPGMTFIDLGANFGLYTVWAARRVGENGRVIAFEPSKREFARLENNIQLNRFSNTTPLNIGASDSQRTANLRIADDNEPGQNTFGEFIYPDTREIRVENAVLDKVDDVLKKLTIGHVDVVKIDVEGHELLALKGMESTLKKDHPVLLIETDEATLQKQGYTTNELFDFLHSFGYHAKAFSDVTGMPEPVDKENSWNDNNLVWTIE